MDNKELLCKNCPYVQNVKERVEKLERITEDVQKDIGVIKVTSAERKQQMVTLFNQLKEMGLDINYGDNPSSITEKFVFFDKARFTNDLKVNAWLYAYNIASENGKVLMQSDITLKTNIADSSVNALEIVKSIRHRQFIWKDSGRIQALGYIAQELQQLEDSLIFRVPQPDGSVRMQPDQTVIIPYLSKAIQELSAKIDDLQQQITELQVKQAS